MIVTNDVFAELLNRNISRCKDVLLRKQKEYATDDDRLHNFKIAAAFQQCTTEQALFGFLAKHLVSLSDMCKSGEKYSEDIWDEKIGDSINYLLLLAVVVADGRENKIEDYRNPISDLAKLAEKGVDKELIKELGKLGP
jgi:hypothetical protein